MRGLWVYYAVKDHQGKVIPSACAAADTSQAAILSFAKDLCHSISLPTVLLIPLYVYWRLTHGSLATGLWFALCTRHYTLLNVY